MDQAPVLDPAQGLEGRPAFPILPFSSWYTRYPDQQNSWLISFVMLENVCAVPNLQDHFRSFQEFQPVPERPPLESWDQLATRSHRSKLDHRTSLSYFKMDGFVACRFQLSRIGLICPNPREVEVLEEEQCQEGLDQVPRAPKRLIPKQPVSFSRFLYQIKFLTVIFDVLKKDLKIHKKCSFS